MTIGQIPGEMDPRDEEMMRATDLLLDLIEEHLGECSVLALFTAAINSIYTRGPPHQAGWDHGCGDCRVSRKRHEAHSGRRGDALHEGPALT